MRVLTGVFVAALAFAVPAAAQDADRKVAGGGITVKGWQGSVDASAAKKGQTINDSKFEEKDGALHIFAGSPSTYWNPANVAKGDYTVSATFTEPKMSEGHPHPYGIFIGGADLGDRDADLYLLCRLRQRRRTRARLQQGPGGELLQAAAARRGRQGRCRRTGDADHRVDGQGRQG